MKIFLIKWALLGALVLGLFFTLDYLITEGLRSSNHEHFIKWNTIVKGHIEQDVLVLGDSRAMVQVSPAALDTILGIESYNLALNGYDFLGQYFQYQLFLKYNTAPKLLVQILGYNTLRKSEGLFRQYQFFHHIDEPLVRELTQNYKGISYWDYHLPFVRYFGNQYATQIGLTTYFTHIDERDPLYYKGYIPREWDWDNSGYKNVLKQYKEAGKGLPTECDSSRWHYLVKMIETEQARGTKIALVYAPTYLPAQQYIMGRATLIEDFKQLAQQYDLPFLDYSGFHINHDQQYFYNSQHLNLKGANLFSQQLAQDLKKHFPNITINKK